ncbi:phospho-sugar mutase [Brevibacterium jeotgali]|uniref:Phosphomannomutase n=1 Tax=Brevibacterium jeotgali TaxID=1262550 RepID=A0A2H1L5N1_9MICO|nr:phospho-sugar mutase [Brevibacterium jeotgali]TWB98945.1 phosphomannomutase [Brevibacterium jeotgali]SMY12224.1 phosphomannomutase [Brevibacterium jeotgali]
MPVASGFTSGFDADVVRAWIADDPDPVTRAELSELLEAATAEAGPASAEALADLTDRFSGPLEFGTAGLRGEIAAGPHRMNRAVVIRAAAGLSAFLADHMQDSGPAISQPFTVVIGCDARYGSADFARDTAAVVTAAGGRALLLPAKLPTPVLAFAVQHLGADAGVMVTASHNPPRDNGYKVYLGTRPLIALDGPEQAAHGTGAQIVPPADELIASRIAAVDAVASVPRADSGWTSLGSEVETAYLDSLTRLGAEAVPRGALRIVTTALHGVGATTLARALGKAGFADVRPVESQRDPDPDFPTVAFPNPEEDGALEEATALADHVDAHLILANDPDADRLSAAVPSPDGSGWYQLSGDEVGLLLGEAIALRLAEAAAPLEDPAAQPALHPVFASSVVSSRALAALAARHGIAHTPTLTGFKWISRVPGIVYGYEEALGYCVDPDTVRDKDGISAALLFAAYTSRLRAAGRTIPDELARIRATDGVFRTQPLTFRLEDTALIAGAVATLRANPPTQLGGSPVTEVIDMTLGYGDLAPTDGIVVLTQAGDRAIVRPSGTEPKLKCYLEAVEDVEHVDPALAAKEPARADPHALVGPAWDVAGARLTMMAADLRSFFRL